MEGERERETGEGTISSAAPSQVSFVPFSPSPSRLSGRFVEPGRPISAARKLAWISLQGRLEGAEEASSAKAIGGRLGREEAVAWELFSPIQRVLIVAIVAVAVAESKKSRQIFQLKKSVELRDEALASMQQKLDNLCEQLNNMKDQGDNGVIMSSIKNLEFPLSEPFATSSTKFIACGCWLCDQHKAQANNDEDYYVLRASGGNEMLKYKFPVTIEAGQEERRMSDLSDWASSVTSAADIQLNNLAIEQDIYNLRRECEEKNATIQELSDVLHSSKVASSKRIQELEDIIGRKNSTITKLKKDMVTLEQKVMHLTRLQRPSYSEPTSSVRQLPVMADNLLYDMDRTTSPSSSDSDSPGNRQQTSAAIGEPKPAQNNDFILKQVQKALPEKDFGTPVRSSRRFMKAQSVSPLAEEPISQRSGALSVARPKQLLTASGDFKRSRRRSLPTTIVTVPQKRWN
ncbi:hypothetical protein RJ641_034125 [Dillenia turbinata]|uniref:Uncharacterized protein n=1 Tax=Dillenia turbinata TaxID=194707 RepID=A0AAN8ZK50_9MAGN